MNTYRIKLSQQPLHLLALFCLCLMLGACNGSGEEAPSSFTASQQVTVNFAISDAAPEALSSVVITIDAIELVRDGKTNQWIYNFFDPASNDNTRETLTVDLLDYQGTQTLDLANAITLPATDYSGVILHVADETLSQSYVLTTLGEQRPLKIPSQKLKLGALSLKASDTNKTFVIEIDLPSSLVYNPDPQRYLLKPHGIRVVEASSSATVYGQVDLNYFNALASCGAPLTGNRVYVYNAAAFNAGLETLTTTQPLSTTTATTVQAQITDHFDPALYPETQKISPVASMALDSSGNYQIAFLPQNSYIAVFTCSDMADDPEIIDEIPLDAFPEQMIYFYLGSQSSGKGEIERIDLPIL